MNDQQLEARLRAWYQANAASAEVPYRLQSVVLDIPETIGAPRSSWFPIFGERRSTLLLAAALLLTLVVGGVLAIGSGLIRLPWTVDLEPPIFGMATECGETIFREGVVLEAQVGEEGSAAEAAWVLVYADGRILTIDPWYPNIEATYTHQRLTPLGVEMLLRAVTESGLTPGCRVMHSDGPSMRLTAAVDGGVVSALVGQAYAYELAPVLDADEVARTTALAEKILRPEDWLPPEAWVDANRTEYLPDRWLVFTQLGPSGLSGDPAEQEHHYPDGTVMSQESIDHGLIDFPDGATLGDYGIALPEPAGNPPGAEQRCLILHTEDALALADSLVEAGASHIPHDAWEIFSEDFSTSYIVQIQAVLEDTTCEEFGKSNVPPAEPIPTPEPLPTGDLSAVDACSLLSRETVDALVRRELGDVLFTREDEVEATALEFPMVKFGVDSPGCRYSVGSGWQGPSPAILTLHGDSTTLDEARYQAELIFGDGLVEEQIGGRSAWLHACLASRPECAGAIALSVDPYFVVITLDVGYGENPPDAAAIARELAAAVIDQIGD